MAAGESIDHRGFTLWLTGLSGAGKSTLSSALAQALRADGRLVEVLDGDEVRTNLSRGLGFSKEDRDINVERIGFVARLLARNGVIAMTAAISPYRDVRANVRKKHADEGVPFIEVFANASIEALTRRDVKGLYKQALAGDIANFSGVTDPYEAPESPEIEVHTDAETVDCSVERILKYLANGGYIKSN